MLRELETLLRWDASGRTWLSDLLTAAPRGAVALGELAEQPGWLVTPLAVATADGRLGAFTYTVPAPRELLAWFIAHPERLSWPAGAALSRESELLRRALIDDTPPGARTRAQDRARELVAAGGLAPAWWRFEEPSPLDCVLITDRLVVTVGTGDPEAPANAWFPERTRLVRAIEAAAQLADVRRSATLWIGEAPADVERALALGAPHLIGEARASLAAGWLGAIGEDGVPAVLAGELERARSSSRRAIP